MTKLKFIENHANKISRGSPLPLYYQLKEIIISAIENDELKPEMQLPPEVELMQIFDLSRTTVRQAIQELIEDGYLYRKHGIGTFVAEPKIRHNAQELLSFSEEMRRRGFIPGAKDISFEIITPNKRIADYLLLPKDSRVYKICRLRYANNVPIMIFNSFIDVNVLPNLSVELLDQYQSLYELVQNVYKLRIIEAEEYVEVTLANEQEAKLLEISIGSPILQVERVAYTDKAKPIEFVKMLYRGDRYKYYSRLKKS